MRDAVLVYFQLPPRMFKTLGAPPRRGAARVRPLPQFVHAPEPFQRRRRVLRADREALLLSMIGVVLTALIPRLVLGIGQSWLAYEIESDAVTSHKLRDNCACAI